VLFVGLGARPGLELGDSLARAGVRGLWVERVPQALAAAAHARFDAAVIRLDDPVCAAARQFDAWRQVLGCPLLLLAETLDEIDEIMALELGADGLLAQPVSARRLRAHLMMLLRRGAADGREAQRLAALRRGSTCALDEQPAAAAGWLLDRVHNRLQRGDRRVDLTEMQAALLQMLLDDLGRVVPRSRLLAAVSRRRALQPRSVDVYVARLRQRLHDERVDDLLLEGVRGRGYMLQVAAPGTAWPVAAVAPALDWAAPALARGPVPAVS
jgi:DNA-binding response OmpR family regulator